MKTKPQTITIPLKTLRTITVALIEADRIIKAQNNGNMLVSVSTAIDKIHEIMKKKAEGKS